MLLQILTYTHHITTMLFGILLSAFFLGVRADKQNVGILCSMGVFSALLYLPCLVFLGSTYADPIYPLLVHIPLLLLLIFYYHFRFLPSLISVLTAYICCQFSNWGGILALSITHSDVLYYGVRIVITILAFLFLYRHVCQTTTLLFTKSNKELLLIGIMPFIYYLFDYATTKFSSVLYSGNKAVVEFQGFSLCISYLIFLVVYFKEYEVKNETDQSNRLIQMQLHSLQGEIEQARKSEQQLSILRHDMRHHLSVLQTFIREKKPQQALEYIQEINQTYDETIISHFCKNEMLNSVLSIYHSRFAEQKIRFDIQMQAPEKLPCAEMPFCAILSNLLENAMHAVAGLPEEKRFVELSIFERNEHLLLLEKNPVFDLPTFVDGIPTTTHSGHGLGIQSIIYYVENQHGQYQFYMEDENFVARIIL